MNRGAPTDQMDEAPVRLALIDRANLRLSSLCRPITPAHSHRSARILGRLLAPQAASIRKAVQAIEMASQEMEPAFLSMGDRLEQLHTVSQRLAAECQELVVLASGASDGHGLLIETTEMLSSTLEFFRNSASNTEHRLEELAGCQSAARALLGAEENLGDAVAPLGFIRTMLRTESARLKHGTRAMFGVLTGAMNELQEGVEGAYRAKFSGLRDTLATMNDVAAILSHEAGRMRTSSAESLRAIGESQVNLRASLELNASRSVRLTDAADRIEKWVETMIIGMQTHDIVSQKLQHVAQALEIVLEALASIESAPNSEIAHRMNTLYQLSQIQGAQLGHVQHEIEEAGSSFRSSSESVIEEILHLDERSLALTEFDEITSSATGIVQVLLDATDSVQRMAGDEQRAAATILDSVRHVREMAAPLGDGISEVSQQMLRLALNTQIQAIQVGDGTGLEVLAMESVRVSNLVTVVSEGVVSSAGQLNSQLVQLASAVADRAGQAAQMQDFLNTTGAERTTALHSLRDRTLNKVTSIGECVDQAKLQAAEIRTAFQDDTLASNHGVQFARIAVLHLSEIAACLMEAMSISSADGDTTGIHTAYTMASEHEIHQNVLAAPVNRSTMRKPVEATLSANAKTPDELPDNVELF